MVVKQRFFDVKVALKHCLSLLMFPLNTYPDKSSFRNIIYLVQGFLIIVIAYLWLEYTRMDGTFKTVYPLIIAIIVTTTQYLIVETGGRYVYKHLGPFVIQMATFWIISFSGIFIGFVMVYFNAQCPGVEKIYPDIFYFYSDHPLPRPSRIAVFYKIILTPWVLFMLLLTQGELRKKLDKELTVIKQINEELKMRQITADDESVVVEQNNTQDLKRFCITSNDGDKYIAFVDIYYISVADHYCELVFKKDGVFLRELIRLSLKEAMANLPSKYFDQVHRSHVVNLHCVKEIVSKGQSYQLRMAGTDELIPASRHRAREFLPKLKAMLNS